MADLEQQVIDTREKYVKAWNDCMVDFWRERIDLLGVRDTDRLRDKGLFALNIQTAPDGRFLSLHFTHRFLEYGLWQDLGVGRDTPHGNSGISEKKRERRPWYSTKYSYSVKRLRDFLCESMGDEFKAMVASALSPYELKQQSNYYKSKGWS